MGTTLGIIEIPTGAMSAGGRGREQAGFPLRRIGGAPFLDWVVRRITDAQLLDQVVVLFDHEQAIRLRHLTPPDVTSFESSEPDALGRFASVCKQFRATAAIRVRLECPFIDADLIDRLACKASNPAEFDYIGYRVSDGQLAIRSKLGLFSEWVRADAIARADRDADLEADRLDAMQYIYSHPENFRLRLIPIPAELDRRDLRLTVSSDEDWEHAHTILDALGPEHLDWRAIVGMLDHQPKLRRRMADLNRTESQSWRS